MQPARIYDYLSRAREGVLDAARALTDDQYRAPHPIGVGSLAQTLHHIMAAEWCYTQRLAGTTEPLGPLPPNRDPESTAESALALDDLVANWAEVAEQTRGAIRTAESDPDSWNRPRTFRTTWDSAPLEYQASCADFFTQLIIHETHHRAQAIHILRLNGAAIPQIDFSALMFSYDADPS